MAYRDGRGAVFVFGAGRRVRGCGGGIFLFRLLLVAFGCIFRVLALGVGVGELLFGGEMGGIFPFLLHFVPFLGRFATFCAGLGGRVWVWDGVGRGWRGTPPP